MKFTVVSINDISKTRILEASPYVCPTRQIDAAITRAEKNLSAAKARLDRLEKEREQIIQNPLGSTRWRVRSLAQPKA